MSLIQASLARILIRRSTSHLAQFSKWISVLCAISSMRWWFGRMMVVALLRAIASAIAAWVAIPSAEQTFEI